MPHGIGFIFVGDSMSYEYKSKIIGYILDEYAKKWGHPELANKPIYLFAKIDKHIKKHDSQYKYGEKSKNYTMQHIRDILSNPDYVCYNEKNAGFEYHKKLMEYVVITVKPANNNEDVFCVSTVYPSSREKMNNKQKKEKETIDKILKDKYTYKGTF